MLIVHPKDTNATRSYGKVGNEGNLSQLQGLMLNDVVEGVALVFDLIIIVSSPTCMLDI
jgi:hypothetical protein